MPDFNAPDLTQRPPRSARCKLGGYVILPRILDKGRATIAGKQGEFHYACPLDQHFFTYTGIDADALLAELKTGKSDSEILAWIEANAKHKHALWEIDVWSDHHNKRGPSGDVETLNYFAQAVAKAAQEREDIRGWFDLLDVDDHVTFGGKA